MSIGEERIFIGLVFFCFGAFCGGMLTFHQIILGTFDKPDKEEEES